MVTITYKTIDEQFKLFANGIRPRLSARELQVLASFVIFQKSGDTASIPGYDGKHIKNIGYECSCGSIEGACASDDELVRCLNCGTH